MNVYIMMETFCRCDYQTKKKSIKKRFPLTSSEAVKVNTGILSVNLCCKIVVHSMNFHVNGAEFPGFLY